MRKEFAKRVYEESGEMGKNMVKSLLTWSSYYSDLKKRGFKYDVSSKAWHNGTSTIMKITKMNTWFVHYNDGEHFYMYHENNLNKILEDYNEF